MHQAKDPAGLNQGLGGSLLLSAKSGLPLYGLLCLIDAAVVALSVVTQPVPPETSFPWLTLPWWNINSIESQVVLHLVAGFLVGASTLNLSKAITGGCLGALIDIDHVGALLGLPVDARSGHSIIVLAILVVLVWKLSLWKWGGGDFALFASMEFAAHFLVAPPGFPLLSPISTTVYSFPNWVYLPVVLRPRSCLPGQIHKDEGLRVSDHSEREFLELGTISAPWPLLGTEPVQFKNPRFLSTSRASSLSYASWLPRSCQNPSTKNGATFMRRSITFGTK